MIFVTQMIFLQLELLALLITECSKMETILAGQFDLDLPLNLPEDEQHALICGLCVLKG